VKAEGGTVKKVLQQKRWQYSPKFTKEAIKGGILEKFEKQQGKQNLWISGAIVSHESVLNITDYNELLAEKMISKLTKTVCLV